MPKTICITMYRYRQILLGRFHAAPIRSTSDAFHSATENNPMTGLRTLLREHLESCPTCIANCKLNSIAFPKKTIPVRAAIPKPA